MEALRSIFSHHAINVCYLLAAALFILGLKGLTHPRTAVRGNLFGAAGMLIAVVVTLLDRQIVRFELIFVGLIVGSAIGVVLAAKIQMTAMPQLVALFNGFGGAASVLVAGAALGQALETEAGPTMQMAVATTASALIGAVTFTGSLIAFAKLQELMSSRAIVFAGQKALNAALFLIALALCVRVSASPEATFAYATLCVIALVLGVTLVIPIGGADMPVVIALLNSYSGVAAASTGFVLDNNMLIIAGSLVGASGVILTRIMCKAMNRSLTNVLFGVMGPTADSASADEVYAGKVKSTSPEELAMIFDAARYVIIVPGYGMAVAQAQHTVRELASILEERGVNVEYAIHPVAGRMPGHMNVLLAEADVSYDKLREMDDINPHFKEADVALVIGANDVVNPLARTDPTSPIAGMPILDVDKARTVVVVKRSLSPGFAGIPNPLFAADNCLMLFGDGKKALVEVNKALKED
jgi:NAD(P) transhydrogenase subunit beta